MNVKTISVTYERKFNLGDYNGAAIGVSLWADISDAEDENACLADLFTEAKVAVKTQALPLLKEQKRIVAQVIEQFAGKPVVQATGNGGAHRAHDDGPLDDPANGDH